MKVKLVSMVSNETLPASRFGGQLVVRYCGRLHFVATATIALERFGISKGDLLIGDAIPAGWKPLADRRQRRLDREAAESARRGHWPGRYQFLASLKRESFSS
jgi:hypothetical protein